MYYGCIYLISNEINKKVYIGKTTKPVEKRWLEHLTEAARYAASPGTFPYQSRFYPALTKYGADNFTLSVLYYLHAGDDINELEKFYIKQYNATCSERGYNISPGGRGGPLFSGHHHSKVARENQSEKSRKARWWNNGKRNIFCEQPPDNTFSRGRLTVSWFRPVQNLTTGEIFTSRSTFEKCVGKLHPAWPGSNILKSVSAEGDVIFWYHYKLKDFKAGYRVDIVRERIASEKQYNAYLRQKESNVRIRVERYRTAMRRKSSEEKQDIARRAATSLKANIGRLSEEERRKKYGGAGAKLRGRKLSETTRAKIKASWSCLSPEERALRNKRNSEGQRGKKRYMCPATGKHKMFIPGQEPEGWVLVNVEIDK